VTYKLEQSEVAQIKSVQAVNKGWTDVPVQLRSGIIAPGSRILKNNGEDSQEGVQQEVQVGVPWTPDEFIEQATRARHPYDDPAKVADRHKFAIFLNLTQGPQAMRELRRQYAT
jgi:hypothetical protein